MSTIFNLAKEIYSAIGYKGLPFPLSQKAVSDYYSPTMKENTNLGTTLRKNDLKGRMYFMPVTLIHEKKEYEIPNAIIGIKTTKKIVETPMVGRQGTVKELISINDYEISIAGLAVSDDWPEEELIQLNELFNINESVEIKSALTDIFLEQDSMVVIKSMDFAEMKGVETVQTVKISLITDRSFDLVIS